jgi:transcription initiation factor IIE alpha subunit
MLKKNCPVKFSRPVSTMRAVFEQVEQGVQYRSEIVEKTGLVQSKVRAALYNLTFIGVIERGEDELGRSVYVIPNSHVGVALCLKGVSSIFHVR